MSREHKLIQSYVHEKYFVSTAFRQSSAAINLPPWYYETLVWEWNKETGKRGELIECEDSSSNPTRAIESHCAICAMYLKKENENE